MIVGMYYGDVGYCSMSIGLFCNDYCISGYSIGCFIFICLFFVSY